MLTEHDMLRHNSAYRLKLVRVYRGLTHDMAEDITTLNGKHICRFESATEKADSITYLKFILGYKINSNAIFFAFKTIPTIAQKRHLDFLSAQLGYFHRRKTIKYLSTEQKAEAWKKELERLGGLTEEEKRVLKELEG